jgi:predicted RNA-binding Zn-ribbon protein involved in translation (DUF1610 family)
MEVIMPLLCIKCDTRVTGSLIKPTFYCPKCDKELTRDEVYKVGNRFFASGVGMMMAMTAALNKPGYPPAITSLSKATSTLQEAKRQKRKKLKGLKMRQRKQTRRKRNG